MAKSPPLSGLLNIHKPQWLTSREVVDKVQRLVRPNKVGHAGTLDPLATGVLIVCIGKATRLVGEIQAQPKQYRAVFELGKTSDTDDVTGRVQETAGQAPVSRAELEAALGDFVGTISQVPSQYSAVHVGGRRAYALARSGEEFELAAREVEIRRLALVDYQWPRLELEIECSSGTYVRALGRDLGQRLGCGAVMAELVRMRIGDFDLGSAVRLEELTRDTLAQHLLPPLTAVAQLPRVVCTAEQLEAIAHGRAIDCPPETACQVGIRFALVTAAGELAAVGEADGLRRIAPRMVFCEPAS